IVREYTRIYLRDIYDDIMRLIDREEMYKERLTGALQLYLALSSHEVNEVMKRLTVLASYIMIPMLVTGIYGMNFKFMPELTSPFGYPFAFFLMFIGVLFAHLYFKKKLLL
ncbi:MAG: magnesium and cobalt transport protein CorA, partial [Candidatus Aenigmarchaeota archaeon]|nr:magnesium and cobalt transport protein CorA [Candidatus Aenigmarchaeota archaeon]